MPIFAALSTAIMLETFSPSRTVQRSSDIAYETDKTYSHSLDLFLPEDRADAPLVVFVHGGAFLEGDRRDAAPVGMAFAREGIATAVVSYRLFPDANAKEATQDVAMAIGWIFRHASDYGITARKIFIVGHSAGAQIVGLIGTNPDFLKKAGLRLENLGGVFAVSGAYDLRDLSDEPASWQTVDGHIYGETPLKRVEVSPSQHIDPNTPPIEVACGTEADNPGSCDRAYYFERALRDAGITTRLIKENGPSHVGMLRALMNPQDPLNAEFLAFIKRESP